MVYRNFILITLLWCSFLTAQQNEEFRATKQFFDYQRLMLDREFRKKYDKEPADRKPVIRKDYTEFMQKLDSIENNAYINTLIKVKNREDLARIQGEQLPNLSLKNPDRQSLDYEAQYPGGLGILRTQIADLFYHDAILPEAKTFKTQLVFVVDRDGSITEVQAEGDHFTFNRQAEIAMYLLPNKFTPAKLNGTPVRYRFRLPISMDLE